MIYCHKLCGHWHFRGDPCNNKHLEEAYQKRIKELEDA